MRKLIVYIVSIFFAVSINAQQTLTTIGGWNAYVHLPHDYNNGENKTYPLILAFPGLGEVGTDASKLLINSPSSWINDGWNGNVFVDGDSVRFIVVTIQPVSAFPSETTINSKLALIKSAYRVGDITLAGFSHGGWCAKTFITGDAIGGPYTYAGQIKNVLDIEGMISDDNSPYPNVFDNFALAASNKYYLGFEQSNDGRGIPTIVNRMNAARAGTARYLITTYGGGVHGYAEKFYGGDGTTSNQVPASFTIDGISQTSYEWIARHVQRDTAVVILPPSLCNEAIPIVYNQGITNGSEIYITDAIGTRPWKGGDTIVIQTGTYDIIHIDSLRGDSCRPIYVKFQPGVVVLGAMRFNYAHYIVLDGYNPSNPTKKYCGVQLKGLSLKKCKYVTAKYLEIGPNPDGVGVYAKIDVDALDASTWRSSGFVMKKIKLTHLYVHNIEGEGFYVGHTSPTGDEFHPDSLGNRIPTILMDSVEISYCTVDSTGWDGIQLSGAGNGGKIFGNTVTAFGLNDLSSQRAGIISGSLTNSEVYDNIVKNGTGNGIQIFGYGLINVHNNTIDSAAQTRGDSNTVTHNWKGEQSFYADDRNNEGRDSLQVNFYNNIVKHYSPHENGAVLIPNSLLTMTFSAVYDNIFTIPDVNPANWKVKHIKLFPGFLERDNILSGNIIIPPNSDNKTIRGIIRFKN